jgi:hypothetical protein
VSTVVIQFGRKTRKSEDVRVVEEFDFRIDKRLSHYMVNISVCIGQEGYVYETRN